MSTHSKRLSRLLMVAIFATFFSSCIFQCQAAEDLEITELIEGQTVNVTITKMRGFKYFKFVYTDPQNKKLDLSITANPLDGHSDPDLYVSSLTQYPNETNCEYHDINYGFDVVVIPYKEMGEEVSTKGKTYYIGVQCMSKECHVELKAARTDVVSLRIDQSARLYFQNQSNELVRFSIPNNNSISKIILTAQLVNADALTRPIHVYINKGERPPESSRHDIYATTSWFDGKAAIILRDDKYFCVACNYTLSIEAEKNAIVNVEAQVEGDLTTISPGERRMDAVSLGNTVTYVLETESIPHFSEETVTIHVSPFAGSVRLYVNPDMLPTALEHYRWKTSDTGRVSLVLDADDRAGLTIRKLYITVKGVMTSTYMIVVRGFTNDRPHLRTGVSESGFVHKNEIVNFLYHPFGLNEANATVTLSSASGNPDLYIKSCQSRSDCSITQQDVDNYNRGLIKQSQSYPIFLVSNKVVGDDTVMFYHNTDLCPHNPSSPNGWGRSRSNCLYCIAVTNAGNEEVTQYNLLATAPRTHTILMENSAIRNRVWMDFTQYYVFTVFDDSKVESVSFQITPISGILNVYASISNRYPNLTNHDRASYLNDLITFKKDSTRDKRLNHSYYIAVKGHTRATYTILATVKYVKNETDKEIFSVTELREGVPQKTTLTSHELKFFKIQLDLEERIKKGEEAGFRINLQPVQGAFKFYVNSNGSLPTNTSYQFASTENGLIINNRSKNFKAKQTYFITVYPLNGAGARTEEMSFVITYVGSSKFMTLKTNELHYEVIDKATKLFFRFEIDHAVETVQITKNMDDKKVDLYVSTDRKNIFPSKLNYNFTTVDQNNQNYITIPKEHIQKACANNNPVDASGNFDEAHKCNFYLSATTDVNSTIYFNLFVQTNQSIIKLREGVGLQVPFPKDNKTSVQLYYIPDKIEDVEFVASSLYRKLEVYAKIIDIRNYQNIFEWKFPSKLQNDFKSVTDLSSHKTSSIRIPASKFQFCVADNVIRCAVTLTVVKLERETNFDPSDFAATTFPGWLDETFAIIAISGVTPLPLGTPFISNVETNSYKYFSFRVTEPNCTILISVTPLTEGNPSVVLSKGADERPSFDLFNYEFSAMSFAGEQLQVSNEDMGFRSMEGVWVVGVYGSSACTFQITVTYEEHKIITISSGIPYDVILKPTETIYFQFYGWYDHFDVNLMTDVGSGIMRINTYNHSTQDIIERLPKDENAEETSYKSGSRERITITNTSAHYCRFCYYLIAVTTDTPYDFRGTFFILGPNEILDLPNGKSIHYYVNENSVQNMVYKDSSFANNTNVVLAVTVYSGYPRIYIDHFPYPNETFLAWGLECGSDDQKTTEGFPSCSILLNNSQYWVEAEATHPNKTVVKNGEIYWMNPYEFYISVYGVRASNFSIVAFRLDSNLFLRDGIPEAAITLPYDETTFIYHSPTAKEILGERLKVFINVYEVGFSTLTDEERKSFAPNITVIYSNLKTGIDEVKFEDTIYRVSLSQGQLTKNLRGQITFALDQRKGQYQILVKNPFSFMLNYTVMVQDQHFIKLPLNVYQMSRIDVGDSEVYEVYVEEKGNMTIDVLTCFGRVEVDATRSLEDAHKGVFNEKTARVSDSHLSRTIAVTPGSLFVRVRSLDGYIDDDHDPVREALYKIRITPVKGDERPQEKFWVRSSGEVTYFQSPDNNLLLKWGHVGYDANEISDLLKNYEIVIKYKLLVADDPIFAESRALCDVEPHNRGQFSGKGKLRPAITVSYALDSKNVKNLDSVNRTIHIEEEEAARASFVSIIAVVEGYNDRRIVWEVPIKYDTVEVRMVKVRPSSSVWFFMIACIVGFVAIVTAVIWYYKRYKTIESLLNYEMQDIRNVAQVSSREEYDRLNPENVSGLLNQKPETMA